MSKTTIDLNVTSSNPSVPLDEPPASPNADDWAEIARLLERGEQSFAGRSSKARSYHIHITLVRRNP